MKSRKAISRTLSKVKSRISSIGSLVSINSTESPNPLLLPPPALVASIAPIVAKVSTTVDKQAEAAALDGAITPPHPASLVIAGLNIKPESWTVFNSHPRYHATAYVKFDISCIAQSSGVPIAPPISPSHDPGQLQALTLELSLTGPGVTLSHYGNLTHSSLGTHNDHWINLIHIGIKDTSLASKLSTSLRSLGRSASRSAGRLSRYTNLDLINRWLHVLESDDANTSTSELHREPVVVHATVCYKHSLLSERTMLEDKASCRVKMTKEEIERAEMSGVGIMSTRKTAGSDDEGEEDEYEERLMEARVLGAPFL